jgi:hypothetical protein
MNKRQSHALDRRGFLKLGIGAGAAMGLNLRSAFAQERTAWEARPANHASVRPITIDMHTHWAPERYTRAQVEMGRAPLERDRIRQSSRLPATTFHSSSQQTSGASLR